MVDLTLRFDSLRQAEAIHQLCEMLQVDMVYRYAPDTVSQDILNPRPITMVVKPDPVVQRDIALFLESHGVREIPQPVNNLHEREWN